jgi:hypothetical protein
LTGMRKTKTTRTDKARRPWISHPCRGVSPRRSYASHTSPGFPTFATSGVPESRASKVIRRRAFSGFTIRKLVEHVALRRVVPRSAAQRLDGGTDHSTCSAAERACAAEATSPMTDTTGTLIEELFGAHAASAPRRRGGVVAARQPQPPGGMPR